MNMSQKQTCERCRVLAVDGRCELGYNNRGGWISHLGIPRIAPQEPCPKPISIKEYFEALNLFKK